MEIKKGISQMAEYPNVEINYVVPKSGNMYYILKDGELSNGNLIATLDPRHAIDETNKCSTVGVFQENGDTLIDFDKEEIKKVTDDLLLVVSSKPATNEVIEAISKKDDEISKISIMDNAKNIENKLKEEMGENSEIIFSDPFREANIYSTDSYNHKLGLDCSFIGKNDKGLYFHTSDINSESKIVMLGTEEEKQENIEEVPETEEETKLDIDVDNDKLEGFKISEEELNNISFEEVDNMVNEDKQNNEESLETEQVEETEQISNDEEEKQEDIEETSETVEEIDELPSEDNDREEKNTMKEFSIPTEEVETDGEDEVFDNAIEVINKMITETNKLNDRIRELEEKAKEQEEKISEQSDLINSQKDTIEANEQRIKEQEKILSEQENKKYELNSILDKANEVLKNIG